MQLIDLQNAAGYLLERAWLQPGESVEITPLEGGVSNCTLYVRRAGEDFVFKQAREQLRVADPWFCSVERIWRECDVLRECDRLLSPAEESAQGRQLTLPRLLGEDRENYAYIMSAAPLGHRSWKQVLLAGEADREIAVACGQFLALLHGRTWDDRGAAERLANRTYFIDLRIDPYYRHVARNATADVGAALDALEKSLETNCRALVHGDFSPKNLLVWDGGLMLVDFEVGHYGDPAFDVGFFLSHLVLKSFYAVERNLDGYPELADGFWEAYRDCLQPRIAEPDWRTLAERSLRNLAACGLARLDGKSQIDYLDNRAPARRFFQWLLLAPEVRWETARSALQAYRQA